MTAERDLSYASLTAIVVNQELPSAPRIYDTLRASPLKEASALESICSH